MVVPEDQDGKSDECSELSRDTSRPNLTVAPTSSRKGGAADQKVGTRKPATIIVDMREFRSELPALIHKRGIEIEPVTLQVSVCRTLYDGWCCTCCQTEHKKVISEILYPYLCTFHSSVSDYKSFLSFMFYISFLRISYLRQQTSFHVSNHRWLSLKLHAVTWLMHAGLQVICMCTT
jgi:hypothetical protein